VGTAGLHVQGGRAELAPEGIFGLGKVRKKCENSAGDMGDTA